MIPPQITRLSLVFGVLVVAFVTVRSSAVPPSFGKEGFYRDAFLRELKQHPTNFADGKKCVECHTDVPAVTAHVKAGVHCQSCHGAAAKHVESFDEAKPYVPSTRADCGRCHSKIVGRNPDFPQQDLKEHNPGERCVSCHTIHEKGDTQ